MASLWKHRSLGRTDDTSRGTGIMRLGLRSRQKPDVPDEELLTRRLHLWKLAQSVMLLINLVVCVGLVAHISGEGVGLGASMPVAIIMAGVSLILTFLSDWFGRHLRWYGSTVYIVFLILFDMACLGNQIGSLAVLSAGGRLPQKCTGVTRGYEWNGEGRPPSDYKVPGFGGKEMGGKMDSLCHIPRLSWVISLYLIVTYIHTTGCSIKLIAALRRKQKMLRAVAEKDAEECSTAQDPTPPVVESAVEARISPDNQASSPVAHPEVAVQSAYDQPMSRWSEAPALPALPPPYSDESSSVADGIPPMKAAVDEKSEK